VLGRRHDVKSEVDGKRCTCRAKCTLAARRTQKTHNTTSRVKLRYRRYGGQGGILRLSENDRVLCEMQQKRSKPNTAQEVTTARISATRARSATTSHDPTFVQIRVLQTFMSEGHRRYYTTVRGPDILRDAVVSGYATFYQINKLFVIFSLLTQCLRGPDSALGP